MVLSISYQNVTRTKKGNDEGMMTVFPWGSNSSPSSSFNTCSCQVAILDVKNEKDIFCETIFPLINQAHDDKLLQLAECNGQKRIRAIELPYKKCVFLKL